LRERDVVATLAEMPKKTVQVRIPTELANDVGIVAAALGKSVPEYVEDTLRAAVIRDMPQAARIAKERADAIRRTKPPPAEE
jgi:hypothetical protein